MEPFLSCATLIIFITLENPEFYLAQSTDTYNAKGFEALMNTLYDFNINFYAYGITIDNLENCRTFYGEPAVRVGLKSLSAWLKDVFKEAYIFFINDETYVIISEVPYSGDKYNDYIHERFEQPFGDEDTHMFFYPSLSIIDRDANFSEASQITAALAMIEREEINRSNDGQYHIDSDVYEALDYDNLVQNAVIEKIENNEVEVYAQPIISSKTKKMVGIEMLSRIHNDDLGYIPPSVFIPIAERSGPIFPLGLQTFEKTCQFAATNDLDKMGIEFININISPVQFQDKKLIDKYLEVASKYDIDFELFDFEITETVANESLLISNQLPRIIKNGASVSLDDFGSGSSNLTRLISYPISVAKLDMSLVWNYFKGKDKIMLNTIKMFKDEDLKIVAEGVETKEMADTLCSLGCEYLQGYYFAKPMPINQLEAFAANN